MLDKVITISREFGSGGRELGIKLAEELKVPFYDKELIGLSAEECGLSEEKFLRYFEKIPELQNSLDQQIYNPFSLSYEVPMSDQVFLAQARVVKKLAEQGPCIIVGRCADRVLDDSIDIFVYAKMEDRLKRMNSLNTGTDPETMENRIREVDKKRKEYYQYYTGCEWGKAQNYHLCLDSGLAGVKGCFHTAMAYLESFYDASQENR